MLFAVNKHTKMHRPVQGVNEASQMTEYIAGADNDGWIDCRTKHNNPLPVGVRVDIKTACMPATVAGQTQMATVFTSPSEDVNWIEAAYYRAPLEALTHKPPLGPRRTQVDSGAVPNESKPKRQVDNETTKPNLLDELVAANERLLDARIAYDDALDAVRKAYPQLTIHVDGEGDVEPEAPQAANRPGQQKPQRVGDVMADGYIAAGVMGGEWVLVAPAKDRYAATWCAAMKRSTLPSFAQLRVVSLNKSLIDAADAPGSVNLLQNIAAGVGLGHPSACFWSFCEKYYPTACAAGMPAVGPDVHELHDDKNRVHWAIPVRTMPA